MVQEYQPKGYNNWTELYLAKHRQSFNGALILAFFLAYCVVGYVEVGL